MGFISDTLRGITSWDSFFSSANALQTTKEKGDLFEHLTMLMLATRPEYCSILKNVWLQGNDMPKEIREHLNLPNTDEGIDLIAETIRGEFWAIQCKFKGQNQSPTYKELSTFTYLANSHCRNISLALLVHTGEKGVKKRGLLGEKYAEIGLDFWLNLSDDDWERFHAKLNNKPTRPVPRIPRPHQQKAIQSAHNHFLQSAETRGRIIMPCGTGKSLTAFWIANSINANSVIIAVPSLSLIKQSLEDWTKEFVALNEDPRPEWIVICSDESTGKLDKDEFVSDAYALGIPTTTSIDTIAAFLSDNHQGRKIVFTTYQSSDRLAEAARQTGFHFDLAILDEAHKTVGVKSKSFSILLSDDNISIKQRVFMTATERVVRGNNDDVYSMDDEDIYGKSFYQLSFKDAIHSNPPIICDYKILTITVSNEEIRQLIAQNHLITDHNTKLEEQESQSMAAAIALRKATHKYGIKHAISFHKSIRSADDFTRLNHKLNEGNIDHVNLASYHISSKKSAGERMRLMNDFTSDPLALMTNARCLTEGVDVPAIDCVLFADPKQSVVDIVQAAGRALRPYKGKQCGYIMMPLIVPDGMDVEEFTETTAFRQVAKIITALSTQDERIAEEFRVTTTGKSVGDRRIMIDGTIPVGMKIDFTELADTINTKIWEKVGKVNWRSFLEARAFVHTLKYKSNLEWRQFGYSNLRPLDIPLKPDRIYKNRGWVSWGDWLGSGTIAHYLRQYRTFKDARKYVQSLNLNSISDWLLFCKSVAIPKDIPITPDRVYLDKGWISWGDWLGTGTVATILREYKSFPLAKAFIQSQNIKSQTEWKNYCKSGNKPEDIPSSPYNSYKDKGWISWGDWFGTGVIAPFLRDYLPFTEARDFVHSINLKSTAEWQQYCKSGHKPENIPSAPRSIYKNIGWISMGDWLGTGYIADNFKQYRSFTDAREFVRSLNLKSGAEWLVFCKSGLKPHDIPTGASKTYRHTGWISMGDWLGTITIANRNKVYRNFNEARLYVRSLKLQNAADWYKYCKSPNKLIDIPSNPERVYKNTGWLGLGDWLGTGSIAPHRRNYMSFEEARKFARSLELKSSTEWNLFCKSRLKPDNIPQSAQQVYKNKGWINWGDWLGNGNIAVTLRKHKPFAEARNFVNALKLKSYSEWQEYCKKNVLPNDIPKAPDYVYKNLGWVSWGDWLGTDSISTAKEIYLPFIDAKKIIQSLNLKGNAEWRLFCNSGKRPRYIPSNPNRHYKYQGWVSWGDWLGTKK